MRPSLFITAEPLDGLRSLESVRKAIRHGHSRNLWKQLRERADQDCRQDPLLPGSVFPGRDPVQARHANPDYTVCRAVGQRLLTGALAALLTGETDYRDTVIRQLEVLFNPDAWPAWRDQAHPQNPADLRTGMLAHDVGLAYDWLHHALTPDQRTWIRDGLERCAIRPFWESVEQEAFWTTLQNNWMTCVVGGLGMAGMALGSDHPGSRELLDFALPRMRAYLEIYGPNGEFNESVAYANATSLPADFFAAYRYFTGGGEKDLARHPFPQTCHWMRFLTLPPGRVTAFGDSKVDAPPRVEHFAAIAAATRDPVLQWFYLQHADEAPDPRALLWFDDTLIPEPPPSDSPLGAVFPAHGGCVSSRTDWNPKSTPCVVYGKAGREENHENDDCGQLCIDGFAQRLITDPGAPSIYPEDFFRENRRRYYNASVRAHNLFQFDDHEMDPQAVGTFIHTEFDPRHGAAWQIDLSAVYPEAEWVRRSVIHCFPGTVAVLDEARLPTAASITLRWHTADRNEPLPDGRFRVVNGPARLTARIVATDDQPLTIAAGEHAYHSPYDRSRMGELLEQRRERFIQTRLRARSASILTLFSVAHHADPPSAWKPTPSGWKIQLPHHTAHVTLQENQFAIATPQHSRSLQIPPPAYCRTV